MAFIKNLKYNIGNFSLDIPTLEIKDKKVNVIVGPSGSGKTTLFNLISGFIDYRGWNFEFDGIDLAKLEISQRQIGIVFQSYELFPHLSAKENIELVMKARNNTYERAWSQLEKFKNMLGLDDCWLTQAAKLSGGEKQRVALLRAIMSNPRLLLLDEPFSALDEYNKAEARQLLKAVLNETELTTLLISHDLADTEAFGPHIIRLKSGQLV